MEILFKKKRGAGGKNHPNLKTHSSGSQDFLESMKRTRNDSVNLLYSFLAEDAGVKSCTKEN